MIPKFSHTVGRTTSPSRVPYTPARSAARGVESTSHGMTHCPLSSRRPDRASLPARVELPREQGQAVGRAQGQVRRHQLVHGRYSVKNLSDRNIHAFTFL